MILSLVEVVTDDGMTAHACRCKLPAHVHLMWRMQELLGSETSVTRFANVLLYALHGAQRKAPRFYACLWAFSSTCVH
jgi:hypothetical protein